MRFAFKHGIIAKDVTNFAFRNWWFQLTLVIMFRLISISE